MKKIQLLGLQTIPEIKSGDNLPQIIIACAEKENIGIEQNDIIILTSKIVSKSLGLTKNLSDVKPSVKAFKISARTGKDPRWVQMFFDIGHEILAVIPLKDLIKNHIEKSACDSRLADDLCHHEQAIFVTKSPNGRIHTCDSGIDGSNHPGDTVSFLPEEPDKIAAEVRTGIKALTQKTVAVILADTEIVPFGTMDFAVGSAGISPRSKMFAKTDLFKKPKFGGMDLIAYELSAAAALLFGQTDAAIPAVIVRGLNYQTSETENIANTLFAGDSADLKKTIHQILSATAEVRPLVQKILLKIASMFI